MKQTVLLSLISVLLFANISLAQSTIIPNSPAILSNGLKLGNTESALPGTIRFTGSSYEVFKDNKWQRLVLENVTSTFEPPAGLWVAASSDVPCAKTCPDGYAASINAGGLVCMDVNGIQGAFVIKKAISYSGAGGGVTTHEVNWHCQTPSGTNQLGACYCVRIK